MLHEDDFLNLIELVMDDLSGFVSDRGQTFQKLDHEQTVYQVIMLVEAITPFLTKFLELKQSFKPVLEVPKQIIAEEPRLHFLWKLIQYLLVDLKLDAICLVVVPKVLEVRFDLLSELWLQLLVTVEVKHHVEEAVEGVTVIEIIVLGVDL